MRKENVLVFGVGLVLGVGAHAFYVALGTPAEHGAAGTAHAGASEAAGAHGAKPHGAKGEAGATRATAHPTGDGAGGATAHSLPAHDAGASGHSVPGGAGGSSTSTSTSADPGSAATAHAGGVSGAKPAGVDGESAAPSSATTAAKPSADEALNAFRELAKEGLGSYGKHGPLIEKFRAMGPEGIALLGEMLRDTQSTGSRFLAAAVLEGLRDPSSIAMLDRASADPDVLVQRMASHALAFMGVKEAIPPLERAMNEGTDWGVKLNAAYGLAKQGEKSGRDFLLVQFRDRSNPMAALMVVGPMVDIGAPEFSAELRPLLGDDAAELGLRLGAAMCAAKARDVDALPLLEAAIASPNAPDSLKDAAKKAVNEITGEARYKVE